MASATRPRDTPLAVLVLPSLLMFVTFAVVPLFGVVALSFTKWDGIGAILPNGLGSWQQVLADPQTWRSLGLTVMTMAVTWAVQTPLSILLGTFIAGHQRYRGVLAVLYFLPLLLSSAALAIAFKALFDLRPGAGLHPLLSQDWLGVQSRSPWCWWSCLAVHPVPHAALPGRRTPDRSTRPRRSTARTSSSSSSASRCAAEVHDHPNDADAGRLALLRPS